MAPPPAPTFASCAARGFDAPSAAPTELPGRLALSPPRSVPPLAGLTPLPWQPGSARWQPPLLQ